MRRVVSAIAASALLLGLSVAADHAAPAALAAPVDAVPQRLPDAEALSTPLEIPRPADSRERPDRISLEPPAWRPEMLRLPERRFITTPTPRISGTATVGKTISTTQAWHPTDARYRYHWLRDGSEIEGATKSRYTLAKADIGKRISVRVTGERVGYRTVTRTSTARTVDNSISSTQPRIAGTARVGKTLRIKRGSWKPGGLKFSYQWYRNGRKVSGATKSTYKLRDVDFGSGLRVQVTAKRRGYETTTRTARSIFVY